jgi:glycosyltransferase involved in cell wall biosynthesis
MNDHYHRSSGAAIAIQRVSRAAPADVSYIFAGCGHKQRIEDLSWIEPGQYRQFDIKSSNPFRLIREIIRLKKWLKEQKCDLIHSHHRRLAVLARLTGVPVLYTGQLVFEEEAWFRWFHPKYMTAITPSVAQNLFETTGQKTVACIGNPVLFPATIPEIDTESVKTRAVCVARLEPVKGHVHLLAAWKILYDRGYRYHLDLVGEGSLKDQLVELVKEYGLSEYVHFCGYTKNVNVHIERALFAILASRIEGQGIVTLEAAANGRASLVTAVPGSVDMVPQNAQLSNRIPYGEENALADCIEQWFSDPKEVVREGERFYQFLKSSSDPEVITQRYRDVYRQILKPKV